MGAIEHTGLENLATAPEIALEETRCGLCGSAKNSYFASSFDYEYQTCSNEWKFVRCQDCNNVYLNPRPARPTLPVIYPRHYYSYNFEQQFSPIARLGKSLLDRFRFSSIQRRLGGRMDAYLDIGCGDGRYLKTVAKTGVAKDRIYGIELDSRVAESLNNEGYRVFSTPFEETDGLPKGQFKLITLFSVLEHMANPHDVLQRAYELLSPGGLVVIEVPNIESWNARMFREKYWGGYHTPRHWNLFSLATLEKTTKPIGFRITKMKRATGHAFWLWSFHHFVRFKLGWETIGKKLSPMACLVGLMIVTPLDLIRAKLGFETDNMLVFLQKG